MVAEGGLLPHHLHLPPLLPHRLPQLLLLHCWSLLHPHVQQACLSLHLQPLLPPCLPLLQAQPPPLRVLHVCGSLQQVLPLLPMALPQLLLLPPHVRTPCTRLCCPRAQP